MRHPSLHQMLVAAPQQLAPQHPHAQTVAMPTALPGQIPYGSIPPGFAQSQRFTGGVVQHQPMNMHPLAALVAALGLPPGLPPHPLIPNGPRSVPLATPSGQTTGPTGFAPGSPIFNGGLQSPAPSGSTGAPWSPTSPSPGVGSGGSSGGSSGGGGVDYHGGALTPQPGLAASLASRGKRGVYNV